jgi:hypothetical protein
VQVVLAPEAMVVGLQLSEETPRVSRFSMIAWETPLRVAVTVAVLLPVKALAVTVKAADVEPAATVTEAGVASWELLSESETEEPPAGAAAVRVTIQLPVALGARMVGLQASEERAADASRFTVAVFETPLIVAVTVAAWLLVTAPAVTVNVADVEPDATVTEAGVVSPLLLSESETEEPPAGAAALSVTVQVLVAPEARLVGLQASEERTTGASKSSVALRETPFSVVVTETF